MATLYETEDFVKKEMEKFNNYLRLFTGEPDSEDSQETELIDSSDSSNEGS